MCVTMPVTKPGVADLFIKDVKEGTAKVLQNPKAKTTGGVSKYQILLLYPSLDSLKSARLTKFITSTF